MRLLIISAMLLLSCSVRYSSAAILLKPSEIDVLLSNQRILNNMVKCLLDEAPCTKQAKEIKKNLSSDLQSACAKCDAHQKMAMEKLFRSLKDRFPKEWSRLLAKYDPDGDLGKTSQWLAQFL